MAEHLIACQSKGEQLTVNMRYVRTFLPSGDKTMLMFADGDTMIVDVDYKQLRRDSMTLGYGNFPR
jgi:hypothetical protein